MKQNKAKTMDLTKGACLSRILLFSIPILIGNVFQQIYNLIDTSLAGKYLHESGLAAMGATNSINSLIVGFATGICAGFAIMVSRSVGAEDKEGVKRAVCVMTAELTAVATVFTVVSLVFLKPLLRAMNTPDTIFDMAYTYIGIILAGMPVTLAFNYGSCILRSLGDSKTPLYCLIVGCVVNVGLDVLFTGVLRWGIKGLALATVLAQSVTALGSIVTLFVRYPEVRFSLSHARAGVTYYREMFVTGFMMGAMTVIYDVGSVLLQSAINGLGDTVIAAHTAARKILMMLLQPLVTLGTACATFAGQNYGAKQYERIKKGLLHTCYFSLVWSSLVVLFLWIASEPTVRLVSQSEDAEVISLAVMNMHINSFFYLPLGFIFPLRMGLQGFNHKVIPVLSGSIEMIVKVIGTYVLVPKYAYVGASFSEPVTWLLCGVFLFVCFLYVIRTDLDPKIRFERLENNEITQPV
ncbi:MAG: MATE family efflux transporter [Clostridia bacterium]|nr:MATE family efflux transporter [Clostridia bacterium]